MLSWKRKNIVVSFAVVTVALATSVAPAAILINELDSDTPGSDTLEFIELYNNAATAVSTNGLVLTFFNGNDTAAPANGSYFSIDLDGGTIPANGYYVVGNPLVANVNKTFDPGTQGLLQNGADAVALYQLDAPHPNDTAPVTGPTLLDAIVYGTADPVDADLLAALGQSTQYDEGAGAVSPDPGVAPFVSLGRLPNGSGTFTQTAPTPGAANVIPEPTSLGLLAIGSLLMLRRRRA